MIVQPIRMEGFIPIFSLILIDLKFIVKQLKKEIQQPYNMKTTTENELPQKRI